MKSFVTSLIAFVGIALIATEANAQFVKVVNNPPGLFNRSVAVARGPGASVALAGGGGRRNVAAAASVGGFPVAASASVGFVPVNTRAAVAFNGRNTTFVSAGFGFPANVAFNGSQVLFVDKNRVRFNSFGISTAQDAFGNVFEVDAFGNARFAGNRLGSSAIVTGFVPAATPVFVNSGGFATFRSSGICGFH
jgi:hypothetical protein